MPGSWTDADFDPQDRAETADETHFSDNGDAFMTLEDIEGVFDATRADGDQDEDDFDEDVFDDADLEEDDELSYRAAGDDEDDFGVIARDGRYDDAFPDEGPDGFDDMGDGAEQTGGEDGFTDFQSRSVSDEDLRRMGYLDR